MLSSEFENLLDQVAHFLTAECAKNPPKQSKEFEDRVRAAIKSLGHSKGLDDEITPVAQVFPDIVIGRFGVEIKFTLGDNWRCIANSVFEGTRSSGVKDVYLMYGKMGGEPAVRWAKYSESIVHVRTSHVPRFEVEIGADKSLFEKFGVDYDDFRLLSDHEKMEHVRTYARSRLKKGERLWWLEENKESDHSLPLQVKLYMNLKTEDKRKLRAESALLCPQIVKSSRTRNKYNDVTLYALTYHGILCPQARDLFSAGSVALRSSSKRGGNYLLRALQDIEKEILDAASYLEDQLFEEYWNKKVTKPKDRITFWLTQLDGYADGWKPSDHLFK